MYKYFRWFFGKIYRIIVFEINFCGSLLFRLLELFVQIFPEDARGCRLRGFIYRPFLKKCGKNFQVGIGAKLEHINQIEVGDDVYIGHNCWISGIRGGITFKSQVMLGPSVKMVSSNHTVLNKSFRFGPGLGGHITIGPGTWIAANSVITAGVQVGECCLIAAGSVVTKNFASFKIIGGVPAKILGDCYDRYSINEN
ncbi:DapH/DapD/GlmU-related protein [Algoriphagus sp.]|uniref:acyltransferase n=1 Tax=Algoriphagus sp. TaxID=1872435 RepID=UPI00271D93C1|nr:acyltransferase [Algoriphagus sp.]MDO8965707.1 acyltransferase [Algoriphagus sp.]MDP3202400.1 acyltransferase [Algoriphagus sp.]